MKRLLINIPAGRISVGWLNDMDFETVVLFIMNLIKTIENQQECLHSSRSNYSIHFSVQMLHRLVSEFSSVDTFLYSIMNIRSEISDNIIRKAEHGDIGLYVYFLVCNCCLLLNNLLYWYYPHPVVIVISCLSYFIYKRAIRCTLPVKAQWAFIK